MKKKIMSDKEDEIQEICSVFREVLQKVSGKGMSILELQIVTAWKLGQSDKLVDEVFSRWVIEDKAIVFDGGEMVRLPQSE